MTTTQVHHSITRSVDATPVWPGPSDDAAWQDVTTVQRLAHPSVHTRPQPGCPLCLPVPCRCGVTDCPDVFDHGRTYAGAETTVWEFSA